MTIEQRSEVNGNNNLSIQSGRDTHLHINAQELRIISSAKRKPTNQTEIALLNPYSRSTPLVGRNEDWDSFQTWVPR